MWLFPILAIMIAFSFNDNEIQSKRVRTKTPEKTYVLQDEESQTSIILELPAGWDGGLIEGNVSNVLAVFMKGDKSLIVMKRNAGDWTKEKANQVHLKSLQQTEGFELVKEPEKVAIGDIDCEYFAFIGKGEVQSEGLNKNVDLLHVVATVVENRFIFRIQATTLSSKDSLDASQENENKCKDLMGVISKTRFQVLEAKPTAELTDHIEV